MTMMVVVAMAMAVAVTMAVAMALFEVMFLRLLSHLYSGTLGALRAEARIAIVTLLAGLLLGCLSKHRRRCQISKTRFLPITESNQFLNYRIP